MQTATQRQAILAATVEMRRQANLLMVEGYEKGGTPEGTALYNKGREMHDYAEGWARKARCR